MPIQNIHSLWLVITQHMQVAHHCIIFQSQPRVITQREHSVLNENHVQKSENRFVLGIKGGKEFCVSRLGGWRQLEG